jgi:hypothetical protein
MFARRSFIVLAVALSVVRCADQPTALQQAPAVQQTPARHTLQWSGLAPQFVARASRESGNGKLKFLGPPLSLDQYTVSFWAVRGESRSVRINYRDALDDTSNPFLDLSISDPVFVPNVGDLAVGDSVLITVTVDTVRIGVSLEPSGLRFGTPAELQIFYGGAGGDLNGDGAVDSTDALIESQLLGLWYREADEPWTQVPAVQSLATKSFTSFLPHFCEYELSFLEWSTSW